jgi:signal transduction histidine kinase
MKNYWGSMGLMQGLLTRLGIVIALLFALMVWLFNHTIDQVGDRAQDEMLRRQVAELLTYLAIKPHSEVRLALPSDVKDTYDREEEGYLYVLHDGKGKILQASTPVAPVLMAKGMTPVDEPTFLHTTLAGSDPDGLYMLERPIQTALGVRYLTVGQNRTIDDVLLTIASHDATSRMLTWAAPAFVLMLLVIGFVINGALSPLRRLSAAVSNLGTHQPGQKLSAVVVPHEVRPLVAALNTLLTELDRAMLSQRQLTGDAAHQLKTPLAVLHTRLELARKIPPAERDSLLAEVRRMTRLVNQMLHYAQLLNAELHLEETDLAQLAREVVARLAPLARQSGVSLAVDAPTKPVMVRLDPLLAAEAVQNLVDNAISFSPQGKTVDVQVKAKGTLHVLDRGPGVPPEERALIFSRFWQADNQGAGRAGSGLGLAIVAEIMRQHGGDVWVTARDTGGSEFGVSFKTT